jgi:hypothetical protein
MNGQEFMSGALNGTLIAHGGGNPDGDISFKEVFCKFTGGTNAHLIYIPTAFSDEQLDGKQNPTSCVFIVLGRKLGHFRIVCHAVSIGYALKSLCSVKKRSHGLI